MDACTTCALCYLENINSIAVKSLAPVAEVACPIGGHKAWVQNSGAAQAHFLPIRLVAQAHGATISEQREIAIKQIYYGLKLLQNRALHFIFLNHQSLDMSLSQNNLFYCTFTPHYNILSVMLV